MNLLLKRVYENPESTDGRRVLVDRLWPRGLTKEKAKVDLWLKEIAPSTLLRKWFNHDPKKWEEFQLRYINELKKNKTNVSELQDLISKGKVTLLYSAKDQKHNEAIVLLKYVQKLSKQ